MADIPQYEFSADEEQAMRRRSSERADPTQLARVSKEFEPASAEQARDVAAKRVAAPARRLRQFSGSKPLYEGGE